MRQWRSKKLKMEQNKRAQIWVETVIYTLIGLSLIGLVLAIVTPRINEMSDRSIIEQTAESLSIFDSKMREVLSAPGNVRVVEFKMKRGSLFFNGTGDEIRYVIDDSRSLYSEPGAIIKNGRLKVLTEKGSKRHKVSLWMNYSQDLTFDGVDNPDFEKFSAASVPYKFSIENKGFQNVGRFQIDIKEIS